MAGQSSADRWVGDDMAPTSLNEGRGGVVPALVAVFHLSLERCLVDGWAGGGGTSGRANSQPKCRGVPNVERRKGAILGQGTQTGFPVLS